MSTLTTHAPRGLGIDPRGPQFAASVTSVVLGARAAHATAGGHAAARVPGRRLRHRRVPRHPAHAVRRAVHVGGPPPAHAPERARGRPAAALRAGRRPRLLAGRPGRRCSPARPSSGSSRSAWPWSPPCSTPSSASASAARSTCCSGGPPPADPRPPTTPRRNPGSQKGRTMSRETTLVSAQWVEDHLDDPKVVLVEVDEDTAAYDKGHIKGAIKLDWTTDLQDQVRRDFVNKAQFEALLSSRGVANDDTVVLYGGNNNWFAAYAYWYFKLYGHDDVKLLDGGRKKWELDSRELTDELPQRETTSYTAQEQDRSIRAFRDEVVGRDRRAEPRRRPQPRRVRRSAARPGPPPAGAGPARRPHPDRGERPVEQGGQRRRHLQVRRRAQEDLHRGRRRLEQGHDRLLPHRRALLATPGSCSRSCSARRT